MEKKKMGLWAVVALMFGGLAYAASYSLPYIKGVFYEPTMQATGANNTQLGWMMTIYGVGNIVFNLLGGYFTDRFDYRKCIVYSLLGTTVLSVWLALAPSVITMYIIWGLLGLTTFFVFNPSIFKLPRMVVPEERVADSVGWFSFAQAAAYMIINFSVLGIYGASASRTSQAQSFKNVVWGYAAFTLLAAVGCALVFHKIKSKGTAKGEESDGDKFTFKQLIVVIKQPGLWFMLICGFCLYSTQLTASYFVPYFGDVFGVAITFSGFLGVLNMYGGRLFTPILSKIATKSKYVSRLIVFGSVFLIALFIMVLLFSKSVPFWILITVSLFTGIISTLFTNICLALPPEAEIPRNATGTAMGLYAAVAYSPDMFQHTMFGAWLDNFGNAGYTYMFIFTIALLVVGGVVATILYRKARRDNVYGDKPQALANA